MGNNPSANHCENLDGASQSQNNVNIIDAISMMGGMSYSLNDEPRIMREIVNSNFYPPVMAKYADAVCRKYASDINFLNNQFSDEEMAKTDHKMENMNPTSFGNIAYIIVNSPSPYKDRAQKMLDSMVELYKINVGIDK